LNKPFLKFLRQRFLQNLICPQGITYNPRPEGCGGGGVVTLKDLVSRTFNYVEQNGYLKILIGCVWGNSGLERWLVALQSLSTIKRTQSLSISNQMSPFWSFWENTFYKKH
jgi:hypothetical protein